MCDRKSVVGGSAAVIVEIHALLKAAENETAHGFPVVGKGILIPDGRGFPSQHNVETRTVVGDDKVSHVGFEAC